MVEKPSGDCPGYYERFEDPTLSLDNKYQAKLSFIWRGFCPAFHESELAGCATRVPPALSALQHGRHARGVLTTAAAPSGPRRWLYSLPAPDASPECPFCGCEVRAITRECLIGTKFIELVVVGAHTKAYKFDLPYVRRP